MWGSATLTMVVSRTTMSWEVRMTKRNTEGLLKRPRRVPGLSCWERLAADGRDRRIEVVDIGIRPFRWYRVGKRKLPPFSIRRDPPLCKRSLGSGGNIGR